MCKKRAGKIFSALFYSLLVIIHSAVYAGEGSEAATILTQPVGVRASGMGEAYTSVGGDVCSLSYNPAGIARLRRKEASFLYQSGLIGDSFQSFNLGLPLKSVVAAVSYFYYTTGNLELIDSSGGSRSIKAEEDYAITLSVSRSLWSMADIGLNLKMMNSTIAEEFTASTYAFDIGGLWHIMEDELFFGLSVQNIGAKLKYDAETESLPLTVRSGISYDYGYSIFSFDIVDPGDGNMEKCIGIEYSVLESIAMRCGYRNMGDTDEISAGFGVELSNLKIDYAWSPDTELNDCHRISLNMRWKSKAIMEKKKFNLAGSWHLFMEARNLFRQGKYKAAQRKFKKVLKLVPYHEESKRCIILCQKNFYENLPPDIQQRFINKCFMKGIAVLKKEKYDKAIEYFEEVYNLNPEYPQVMGYLQWTKHKLKK